MQVNAGLIFSEDTSQAQWKGFSVWIETESDLWVNDFERVQDIFKMMVGRKRLNILYTIILHTLEQVGFIVIESVLYEYESKD